MFSNINNYYLYLNYICNQDCIFCASPQTNNHQNVEISYDHLCQELSFENLEFSLVTVSGGEPTCYSRFIDLIDYLASRNAVIDIMTNGIKLAETSFADNLLKHNINSISVPIYGFQDTHNAIVKSNSFNKLLNGIDAVVANKTEVNIKLLITQQNYLEIHELLRFLVERYGDVPFYTINTLIYGPKAHSSFSWVPIVHIQSAMTKLFSFAFEKKLSLSISFVPACAVERDFLLSHLLEFYSLGSSKYSQQISSTVRIITPSENSFYSFTEDATSPVECEHCDLNEICTKLHPSINDYPDLVLGLTPVSIR